MSPLPPGTFDVALADPPWRYGAWKGDRGSRTAESFYSTLTPDDVAQTVANVLAARMAFDCAVFLWCTAPAMPAAWFVVEHLRRALRLEYKTVAFTWIKLTRAGTPKMGMGHYTRGNAEFCLLLTRGRLARSSRGVHSVIQSQIREHSRKPVEQYERIEALYAGRRYLELFARPPVRDGWAAWGNEVEP